MAGGLAVGMLSAGVLSFSFRVVSVSVLLRLGVIEKSVVLNEVELFVLLKRVFSVVI